MTIHVAVLRRVKSGKEAALEQGLRDFFQSSFSHHGVQGAHMITPAPGGNAREYGILRSFADESERDEFYASPDFKQWDARARDLTEGAPEYRELHGLEAWFRSPALAPPRWKMATATLIGVYPTSLLLGLTLGPLTRDLSMPLQPLAIAVSMVALLTWVVMPVVTRILHKWLRS